MPTHRLSSLLLVVLLTSCGLIEPDTTSADDWSQTLSYSSPLYTLVKLPKNYDPAKTYPMVVALHGNGGTAGSLAPQFNAYSQEDLILVVPQGAYAKQTGGYSWYYLTSDRSLWEEVDTEAVNGLMQTLRNIQQDFAISQVFVLGFSQGAAMAYMAGLLNPSEVTGVLAISGQRPQVDQEGSIVHAQDIVDAQDVNLFVARGDDDPLLSRNIYTEQVEYFRLNGYSVSTYSYDGGHYLTEALLKKALKWMKNLWQD